jgi:hypothetical protein
LTAIGERGIFGQPREGARQENKYRTDERRKTLDKDQRSGDDTTTTRFIGTNAAVDDDRTIEIAEEWRGLAGEEEQQMHPTHRTIKATRPSDHN